jgi:hypothetical protein
MTGPTELLPAETEPQVCRPGLPRPHSLREIVIPALAWGQEERELASPSLSFSIATGPHCPSITAYRSTIRSSTPSADRSPNCDDG